MIWFLIGFISPMALSAILNLGIIWDLPNHSGLFESITGYLGSIRQENHAVEISVGIATILVLFYGFIQFGYSLRFVPPIIVKKYILRHRISLLYTSSLLSFVVITSFFGISTEIHYLNHLLALVFLCLAIGFSTLYFGWLVRKLSIKEMVKLILYSPFLRDKGAAFFSQLSAEEQKVAALATRNGIVLRGQGTNALEGLVFEDHVIVLTERNGFVRSIDVELIRKIADKLRGQAAIRIELGVSVGMPSNDSYLLGIKLMKDDKKLKHSLEAHRDDFRNCFKLDQVAFEGLEAPVDDLIDVFEHLASESPRDLERMEKALREYFRRDDVVNEIITGKSYLLQSFVSKLEDATDRILTENEFGFVIATLFAMREQVIGLSDPKMMISIHRLMNSALWGALMGSIHYNRRIATHVLHLRDLTFVGLYRSLESEPDEKALNESLKNFYRPVVWSGIQSAGRSLYYLVKYSYHRPKDEVWRYIVHNANDLVGFLSAFPSVDKFDYIISDFKTKAREELSREIVRFGAYLFLKSYYSSDVDSNLFRRVGAGMVNFVPADKYLQYQGKTFLDDLFYDYSFVMAAGDRYREFEEPDIITTATSTGFQYDFSEFWIAVSILRSVGSRAPRFIPSSISPSPAGSLSSLERVKEAIPAANSKKLADHLHLPVSQVEPKLKEYESHITGLIDKSKNH